MPAPPIISTWDSGLPLADWDSGLQWDINTGPSLGTVAGWLALVTSEHASKPNYMAMLAATFQPLADNIAILESIPGAFDLDTAVGSQLDTDGQWIGIGRNINTPLSGVFFSWDVAGLGWGEGNWTPGINTTQLITLPDAQYRNLLYAKVAANHWDGSIPGAYKVFNLAFQGTGFGVLIQDLQGMHMSFALTGPVPDAVTQALFTSGYFNLKPAGVHIDKYYLPPVSNVPYFGFGVENDNIAGWGVGYWGVTAPGS
jgi:Protein of unknown function (DUF2612)